MVRVPARPGGDVQGQHGVEGEGAKELLEQLGVHLADLGTLEPDVPGQEGAAGDIDRGLHQGFVHRDQRAAEPADTALVTQRAGNRGTEDDADVLGGVVKVDVQVAVSPEREVDQAVPRQRCEHVIEEADTGRNLGDAGAVEVHGQGDIGFLGLAVDRRNSGHDDRPTTATGARGPADLRRGTGSVSRLASPLGLLLVSPIRGARHTLFEAADSRFTAIGH
jgi:hypothetical protein